MRFVRPAGLAAIWLVVSATLAACGSSGPFAAPPSLGADAVLFTAKGQQFTATSVHVPADKAWTLALDNQDGLPHNVLKVDKDNKTVFASTIVSGPVLTTDPAPALAPGSYRFTCASTRKCRVRSASRSLPCRVSSTA